jgi:hypothetical protein
MAAHVGQGVLEHDDEIAQGVDHGAVEVDDGGVDYRVQFKRLHTNCSTAITSGPKTIKHVWRPQTADRNSKSPTIASVHFHCQTCHAHSTFGDHIDSYYSSTPATFHTTQLTRGISILYNAKFCLTEEYNPNKRAWNILRCCKFLTQAQKDNQNKMMASFTPKNAPRVSAPHLQLQQTATLSLKAQY